MAYDPGIDLDLPVNDRLVLGSVPGAVDYLAEELRALPGATVEVLRRDRDGLVVGYDGPLRPLAAVRYFATCAVALGAGTPDEAWARLSASRGSGALAALRPPDGTPRFRVGAVGDQRWPLRDLMRSTGGWINDATGWDVNVEPGRDGLVAEIGALYLTRRFGELQRTPASTNPLVAAVMVRLAKIEPGQNVLDPFCGAGTLLVLAGEMAEPGRLIGCDLRTRWLTSAADNLRTRGLRGTVLRADARRIPLASGTVDRLVANLPFGKRVGSHQVNTDLYPAALREVSRVLTGRGRAVLLTDDKRLFRETVQRTPLIRVIKEIVLERGGLHPSAYVLTRRRGGAR